MHGNGSETSVNIKIHREALPSLRQAEILLLKGKPSAPWIYISFPLK